MLTVVSTSSFELLQPIHSGASCLSCCLIYKVHTALSGGLLSYHSSFPLSSTFFKFFQTFSCSHPQVLAVLSAVLADSLIMLPHSFFLVKHFFQVFQTFSCSFLEKLGGERRPFGQLIEDITFGTFCQALFSSVRLLRFSFETLNRFCLKAFRARAGSARL